MIHFSAPIMLGCGIVNPVYNTNGRMSTPATACALLSRLKTAAMARKNDFMTRHSVSTKSRKILRVEMRESSLFAI